MIRKPGITARQGLWAWTRFYGRLLALRDDVVTADFSVVTRDFGTVIRRVNEKFGTAFEEFEHSEENLARCFDLIERRNRERYGILRESMVALTSQGVV